MIEVTTGGAGPGQEQIAPTASADTGVTVYFPGGGQDLIYVQIDGQWVAYEKSVPPQAPNFTETSPEPQVVHWAGYTCHSPYEITREPQRRVYYDPAARPDLFPTKEGGPPTAPLPVLDLVHDSEDPKPWLDPETANRFSSDEARTATNLLNYAPRTTSPEPARKSVPAERPRQRRPRAPILLGGALLPPKDPTGSRPRMVESDTHSLGRPQCPVKQAQWSSSGASP